MTTTYTNTSCNSENIVACLVSGERLLHACTVYLVNNTDQQSSICSRPI